MPYCRECGKEVKDDWITCPYCSHNIGPLPVEGIIAINDSVVMGGITTINDSDSISSAVQSASKCTSCGSIGTMQLACIICKKIAFCSICKDETYSKRNIIGKWGGDEQDWEKGKLFSESRLCEDCYHLGFEKEYSKCTNCLLYFEKSEFLENVKSIECYSCRTPLTEEQIIFFEGIKKHFSN